MPKYSKASLDKLATCHPDLQLIFKMAIELYDIAIIEGVRPDKRQAELFKQGKSKCDGVKTKSMHQAAPDGWSYAVDAAPSPINWTQSGPFFFMAGILFAVADNLAKRGKITHKLRWGHDWDGDKDFFDQTFNDSPHFELIKP